MRACQAGRPDVATGLACLCTTAVDELRMSGAVVSLMANATAAPGQLGAIAASSGAGVRRVEELEFSLGEGPGSDAFLTSRPVLTSDLRTATGRWPGYAPAACAAGSLAVFAFPMHVGAARFGVLSLHMSQPRTLTSAEIAVCLMVTELATEIVLDALPAAADRGPPVLPRLDVDRDRVYQAQGMVMVQLGVSLPEALSLLRAHAFATGQELTQLAADVLAGRAHPFSERDGEGP